jgi:nucleoside-diphosphate-sugar epimerase
LNVSSNIGTSTKALAEKCIEISGKKTRIEFLDARQSDLDSIILDNSLAMKKLGFSPTPLEIGLEKTMKWLNENF